MSWGCVTGTPDAVYWTGNAKYADCTVKVLLIGSAKNMTGNTESQHFLSYSHLFYFLNAYANDLEINNISTSTSRNYDDSFIRKMVDHICRDSEFCNEPAINCGFVAKVLYQKEYEWSGLKEIYTVGTPLYVSLL